ncbi:sensor histidine kinase [Streptomyces sp. NPDC051018]|uniref:sensor histidine kinase n=1 Tax=Streptomyces sp. NPDC051018 TaxID=3365639 RepID=UPI0037A5F32E
MFASARSRLRLGLPHGRAADAAVAAAVLVLVAVGSLQPLIGAREEPWPATVIGWTLIVLVCGSLYFRRSHPVAVAAFTIAGGAAYYLTSTYDGPLLVTVIVALYAVAAEGRLQAAVALASLTLIATGVGTFSGNDDVNSVALFMLTGWIVGVIALGRLRHTRLVHAREVEQRAVSEERLRIARELHDVIGHHISLVNVQSSAALRRLRKDSVAGAAQAEEALAAIKDSSREALRDLRATLGILRASGEAAPTAPAPGLDRVGELVESARLAGLDVRTRFGGERRPLPTEVDLAAYRILQESLTNVTRHSRATAATIEVGYGPRELTVEITDNGQGTAPHGTGSSGSGITGMRERARALGGELTAGPLPEGFGVRARLPYASHRNGASPLP